MSVLESGGSVRDLINEMRGEDGIGSEDEFVAATEDDVAPQTQNTPKKTSVVPKGIVSTRSVSDLINEMRGGEDAEAEDADDDVEAYVDEPQPSSKGGLVVADLVILLILTRSLLWVS